VPKPTHLAAAALLLAALAGPRAPQAQPGPPAQGRGEAEPTVLELSEAARREVPQDEMAAALTAHAEAEDAAAAQNTVNLMMATAVEAARKAQGVRHASGGYSVGQRQERENGPMVWVAEQQLNLTGGDGASLLRLVGDLQGAGLVVQDLRWQLAAGTRRNVERQLLAEALDALQRTARTAADGLGLRVAGWRRVSLVPDGQPVGPVFRARMAATMAAEMAPPVAAAGTSEVVVTVNAEALLASGR
jgi:predicted secreted protein